jgi:ADP-ribosyl-[dinitrogen reductase] hydrolase
VGNRTLRVRSRFEAVGMNPLNPDAVIGCLLGQAIGDMMGLPAENLGPRRVARLFPHFRRPRFLLGHGMGSDDTEHACLTAQALLRSGGDRHRFRRSLAWRLRWWFAAGPPGIGLATLKSCLKLWLGWPSNKSGVRSAGNGPAMRSAILFASTGCMYEPDGTDCQYELNFMPWISDSTRLTHNDLQADLGALAICRVAGIAAEGNKHPLQDIPAWFWDDQFDTIQNTDLQRNLKAIRPAYEAGKTVAEFAEILKLKRGVTGYIAHTVPVAIYTFLKHPDDYRTAIESVIRLGGDTDTVAAITGALVGARVGRAGIPKEWLERWADWPRSIAWMETLARKLAEGKWREAPQAAVPLAWWAIPFRNLFFFVVVLAHIFRRLLPPY